MTEKNVEAILEKRREARKRWLNRFLGDPDTSTVTLAPDVEPVMPEPNRCGAGRGPECCIFLTVDPDGFCCERHGPLHDTLLERRKDMVSDRAPEAPYPECMIFAAEGA